MNKFYKYVVICFLFLLGTSRVFATHIQGMDLTFKCTGNNTYTFTLNFYRDCSGIEPIIKPLFIQSASKNYSIQINLTQVGNPINISPLCHRDSTQSTCFPNGTLPGTQDYVFQGTFTLPYAAKDWIFYYDDEARNPAITNIVNPGGTGIRVIDSLDNTATTCVSSPIFSTPPVPYVCNGQAFNYNHGGYDSEGDSLVYKLVAPIDNQTGQGVIYIPGLSYDSVLIEQPGISYHMDAATGQISFTPKQGITQITVTAVRIYIYRGGKNIGFVTRDIEIIVRDCDATPPYDNGIENLIGGGLTGPSSFTLCANTPTSFQITARDTSVPKVGITVSTNAKLVLPGATTSVTDTNPAVLTITWTPTNSDTGFHNFTVSLRDDNCPLYGIQVYAYQIYVSPSTFASPDVLICQGQSTLLSVTGGRHFVWTPSSGLDNPDTSNPIASPTITTTYVVKSNLTSICKNKDTVVVNVQPAFHVNISADTGKICPGTMEPLNAVIAGGGGGTYVYSWTSIPAGFSSTSSTITDTPKVPTRYYVSVTNGPCSDSSSFLLNIDTTANANFIVKDTVCASQQYIVTYAGHSLNSATFVWSFNGGTVLSGSGRGPYLVDYENPGGPYTMSLSVANLDGCSDFKSQNIYVGTPFNVHLAADSTICRLSSTTLQTSITGGANNKVYNYIWTSTPTGFTSDSSNPIVSPMLTTTYHVLSQSLGCSDTGSVVVVVDSNALATFIAVDTICQAEPFNITFQGYSQSSAIYNWSFDSATIISGSARGPYSVMYQKSGIHKISLVIDNPDGCNDSLTKNIYVAPQFNVKITGDTIICPSTSSILGINFNGGNDGPYTYSWKSSQGDTSTLPSPVVSPTTTTTYSVVVQSKTGCSDSSSVVVHVDRIANAQFAVSDTACLGEMVTVTYNGTSPLTAAYYWVFKNATIVSGTGYGPYTLQYQTPGYHTLYLKVSDSIGCSDTIAKDIYIQPLPQDTFTAAPRIGCEPLTVGFSINSVPGSTYLWSFGDGKGGNGAITSHTYNFGIYSVTLTVTDKLGCVQTYIATNYITVDTPVIAAFTVDADTGSYYGYPSKAFQFTNKSKYASSYTWYFGDGTLSTDTNPTHSYAAKGDYYIMLIACDSLGCCDTTRFGPIHMRNTSDFYVPTAFTPTGATNNRFHIIGFDLSNATLKVYDRWGMLIFDGEGNAATDSNEGWDGTYKGKLQPLGTYVWYASATLESGKVVTKKGDLTLIR